MHTCTHRSVAVKGLIKEEQSHAVRQSMYARDAEDEVCNQRSEAEDAEDAEAQDSRATLGAGAFMDADLQVLASGAAGEDAAAGIRRHSDPSILTQAAAA